MDKPTECGGCDRDTVAHAGASLACNLVLRSADAESLGVLAAALDDLGPRLAMAVAGSMATLAASIIDSLPACERADLVAQLDRMRADHIEIAFPHHAVAAMAEAAAGETE